MTTTNQSLEEKRSRIFLASLGTYVPLIGILAAVGFIVLYFVTKEWQLLAVASCALVGSLVFFIGYLFTKRNWDRPAAVIMLVIGVALFPACELFLAGIEAVTIVGSWVVAGVISWFGIRQLKWRALGLLIPALATAAIIMINSVQPLGRLRVTDPYLIQWLLPLVVVLGGALLLMVITRGVSAGRLQTRLLLSFLIIVLIPVVTIGATSTIRSIESDRGYAFDILQSAIDIRKKEIDDWIVNAQSDVAVTTINFQARSYMLALLTRQPGESIEPTHSQLISSFYETIYEGDRLQEMFLMNAAGIVIADTLTVYEGLDYRDEVFFQRGLEGLYTSPPALFEASYAISVMITYPVFDDNGRIVGVLAGRATLNNLNQVVLAPLGSQTDIIFYMVDSNFTLLTSTAIGALPQAENQATRLGVTSHQSGRLVYTNSEGLPVVGAYTWLPELETLLVAEIPQSTAFGNIRTVVSTSVGLAILSALIALLGAVYTIRSLSYPLISLTETAKQIEGGNLEARVVVDQQNELGTLANTFNSMTAQLQELVTDLEARVSERTRDLERRSLEIQTAAEVARDASTARNVEELLNRSALLIRERFGFYHVGVFLVDEHNEYAILRAAGGEAGKLMLASGHKIKIGELGIVGHVTRTGESRVVLDTGADAVHFRNPLLPYTRSEMTLPLKTGERIIGALDVQSDKSNAFDENDVTIMQVLADQLAVAIEKTRLVQDIETTVAEMEKSYREYTEISWRGFIQKMKHHRGYRYEGISPEPIEMPPAESSEAIRKGVSVVKPSDKDKSTSMLSVPIRLRGQTLGALNLRLQMRDVPSETVALVEEAASRLALALENARLIEDAKRLATREKQINLITAQAQRSAQIDTLLQNTIRELGDILDVPRSFIQIGFAPPDEKKG